MEPSMNITIFKSAALVLLVGVTVSGCDKAGSDPLAAIKDENGLTPQTRELVAQTAVLEKMRMTPRSPPTIVQVSKKVPWFNITKQTYLCYELKASEAISKLAVSGWVSADTKDQTGTRQDIYLRYLKGFASIEKGWLTSKRTKKLTMDIDANSRYARIGNDSCKSNAENIFITNTITMNRAGEPYLITAEAVQGPKRLMMQIERKDGAHFQPFIRDNYIPRALNSNDPDQFFKATGGVMPEDPGFVPVGERSSNTMGHYQGPEYRDQHANDYTYGLRYILRSSLENDIEKLNTELATRIFGK
jgi:hypothetical protein